MLNIGVVLSGCGFLDGAEIHESVLTLTHLDRHEVKVTIMAPNRNQHHVINHLDQSESNEKRNVLVEAARIARGQIVDLATVKADDLDAIILPGGFGAAKNLSDFAFKGAEGSMDSHLQKLLRDLHQSQKPIGAICISPAVLCLAFHGQGIQVTIGNDADTASAIKNLGAQHTDRPVNEICIDHENKIVSTPAYMYPGPLHKISEGISKCVDEVLKMAQA